MAQVLGSEPVRVGVVGVGAMGEAIARRVARLPELELGFVVDRDLERARRVATELGPGVQAEQHVSADSDWTRIDVLVEATSSVYGGLTHCVAALRHAKDVVLMNAEVDLAFRMPLRALAEPVGALVSSDAGDQHGVLMRMAEELRLWGVEPILYGNIKGFLDRRATPASVTGEARKRNLDPSQCCAYTDGSKLNIEMALVGNALGAAPAVAGMVGLECDHVHDVLAHLDARRPVPDADTPEVDYVLGAEPGGGVYIVGTAEDAAEAALLDYYKVPSSNGRYLFHRPYHLCHLETPTAVLRVSRDRRPLPDGPMTRRLDVFAHAKTSLRSNTLLTSSFGSEHVYGLVDNAERRDAERAVPQCLLEAIIEFAGPVAVREDVAPGHPLRFDDLDLELKDAESWTERLSAEATAGAPVASGFEPVGAGLA
jgi:predicted homoserine dehydrogenase-like protein